jgi:predicted kinase
MKAIIGIGVPGCGKTTLLKPLAEKDGLVYVNADDIRLELTGDPADHSKEPVVWRIAYDRIKAGLQKRGVVVDATHSKRKDRRKMVEFCRENGARTILGYWIKTPLETCKVRNQARRRIVPEHSIEEMHRRLTENPPTTEEGFDRIIETAAG